MKINDKVTPTEGLYKGKPARVVDEEGGEKWDVDMEPIYDKDGVEIGGIRRR